MKGGYQMADFIFNSVDVSKYVVVEDIRRILVSTKNSFEDFGHKNGSMFLKKKLGSKIIEVDVRLIERVFKKKLNEIKDILLDALIVDSPKKLELRDYPDRYELCLLDGDIDFNKFLDTGFITLKFINPDGIFYSKTESKTLENKGNLPTPFIIKGTFSTSLVTVVDKNTLKKLTIDGTSKIGHSIVINMEDETVTINGTLSMDRVSFDSDFFYLNKGLNTIEVKGIATPSYSHRARWM